MEELERFVTIISDFIWGGALGDRRIVPVMGPIAWALLGTGLYHMIRVGGHDGGA